MSKDIILIEDVPGLGEQGKRVKVSDGYARNYLLPRKLATPVTAATLRQLSKKQAEYDARRLRIREDAQALATKLKELDITIKAKAGNEGKIFGSVTAAHVLQALKDEKFELAKHQVVLENPIKELGDYHVLIKLTSEIHTTLNVHVVAE
ncbi:MAG TPA: 50S ribosomal protein L9 [Kiritimatiellia bacterium]|nr:50S ribosomal protein L9 [Kiritimatiellia bacterium]